MIEDKTVNNEIPTYYKLDILRYLLQASEGDYITEHLIRDVNKIYDGLFK